MTGAEQKGLRVDFITLHWYGSDFSGAAVNQFLGYVDAVHKRYGRPIWVTEYGLMNFSGSAQVPDRRATGGVHQRHHQGHAAPVVRRAVRLVRDCPRSATASTTDCTRTGTPRPTPGRRTPPRDSVVSHDSVRVQGVGGTVPADRTAQLRRAGRAGSASTRSSSATTSSRGGTTAGTRPAALPWLGALAARTERVLIGTSVLTPTFRYHPAVVAQAFATLGCLAPRPRRARRRLGRVAERGAAGPRVAGRQGAVRPAQGGGRR